MTWRRKMNTPLNARLKNFKFNNNMLDKKIYIAEKAH